MNELLTNLSQMAFVSTLGAHYQSLLPLAVFAVVAGSIWLITAKLRKPNRLRQRLGFQSRDLVTDETQTVFSSLAPALAAQLPESKKESGEFRQLLRGAGLYSPRAITTVYALRFLLLIVPLILAGLWIVTGPDVDAFRTLIFGAICGAGLSIAPRFYVYVRRSHRRTQILQGLPDTMDMLAMCMDGGIGLSASLTHVAAKLNSYPALAQELTILKRQAEVSSLKQALADFSNRVDVPEVRALSALLSRGDRIGTQLSGSLLEQSDHMRTQRRQRATMQANKTPVKLVLPLMFCFAPAALILLVSPAVLELRDFLVPTDGQGVLIDGGDLNTEGGFFETLDRLDQDMGV